MFSTVVELMTLVTLGLRPSLHAAGAAEPKSAGVAGGAVREGQRDEAGVAEGAGAGQRAAAGAGDGEPGQAEEFAGVEAEGGGRQPPGAQREEAGGVAWSAWRGAAGTCAGGPNHCTHAASSASASSSRNTGAKVSCDGIPLGNSRHVLNHPRPARAKLTTSVQQSAPPITAHTDIASMSSSPCRLVRIILGSGTSAKCSSRRSRTFSLIVDHSASCLRNLSLHARHAAAFSASGQKI